MIRLADLPWSRLPRLDSIADRLVVRSGTAPAAAVAVAVRRGAGWDILCGAAGTIAPGPRSPTTPHTVFDLASVSKPFVAVTAARLAAAGSLDLAAAVHQYLPELQGSRGGDATLEQLLAHRAHLLPHIELFAPLRSKRSVRFASALLDASRAARPPEPGRSDEASPVATYSDLGYLVVGHAIERAARLPLDRVVAEQVTEPLSLNVASVRQWRQRAADFRAKVAPTEFVPWRGGTLRGVVHDENAWALAGFGLAGHAGLFGTAPALAAFGATMLDALGGRSPWLAPSAARRLIEERPGGSLRAGFDGRSPGASAAGTRAGPDTFGHLGYTGTSFWCDPGVPIATVLLTNRVCPTRDNTRIRTARPLVHDALYRFAEELP